MKFSAFIKHLIYLGFSEKEARVYLASLESGSASVADIAERAGVKRSTAYVMLKSLAARGLVGPAENGKKSDVCALHPQRVLEMIEEEKKAVEMKHGLFTMILPDLLAALSVPQMEMATTAKEEDAE